jgi:SAM-dependent methyltransferase
MFSRIYGKIKKNLGYAGSIDLNYFNLPVGFMGKNIYTTERLVEIPFILNFVEINGRGRKILDFGCSKSQLVLQFASQGYKTIGVDFRPYPIKYPNFKFYQMNVLNLPEKDFDIIVALSVVEHIGLSTYNKENKNTKLDDVMNKLYEILKQNGKLILTFPMGISYSDNFLHCFTYEEAKEKLLSKFKVQSEQFYLREGRLYWRPCTLEEIRKVSNAKKDRRKGVNSVACYVLSKEV